MVSVCARTLEAAHPSEISNHIVTPPTHHPSTNNPINSINPQSVTHKQQTHVLVVRIEREDQAVLRDPHHGCCLLLLPVDGMMGLNQRTHDWMDGRKDRAFASIQSD